MSDLSLSFSAKLWLYQGQGAWFFVTLPKKESSVIKHLSSSKRRGWGSVPVRATISQTSWKTSIFPDSKAGAYLLPVKADIRKKENLSEGSKVTVELEIDVASVSLGFTCS
ncbi:MAG: DUF1905 domain-containing protein [Alphaproteobacteria bacterium]|nr:DUF1905 domain-containing protein [Alphaproteobacteria bacterium]